MQGFKTGRRPNIPNRQIVRSWDRHNCCIML